MFSRAVVMLTLVITLSQSLTINTFRKDLLCDLTERISKGCSREVATNLNLIQCVTLCGRNDSCIGASLDGNGKCFLHQECHDLRFCITEDTGHHYMSKYCEAPKNETGFCTKCMHRSCYARTCSELVERTHISEGDHTVDPDGPAETTDDPEVVYCDMTLKGGVGVSVIGHDKEERTFVQGYEMPYSYEAKLHYDLSFEQVIAVVDHSQNCEQYVSWECSNALFYDSDLLLHFTGWRNRSMQVAGYFGGGTPGTYQCTCGKTNTCVSPDIECNCNKNDIVLRKDEGYLTVKEDLPMYAFVAGDNGDPDEYAFHTIGKLHCWGTE